MKENRKLNKFHAKKFFSKGVINFLFELSIVRGDLPYLFIFLFI